MKLVDIIGVSTNKTHMAQKYCGKCMELSNEPLQTEEKNTGK